VLIHHAISTALVEIDCDVAHAETVCHCPVVLDRGGGPTARFFKGSGTSTSRSERGGVEDLKAGRA
jgi:hypothetical protein